MADISQKPKQASGAGEQFLMSVEDFETTRRHDNEDGDDEVDFLKNEANDDSMQRALMNSKVRRNLDKPCRTSQHSTAKASAMIDKRQAASTPTDVSDGMKPGGIGQHDLNAMESGDDETNSFLPTPRDHNEADHFNRLMVDASPSISCNASQMLMKSLMTSYNAGNVQFYENLHKKYFDKAKGGKSGATNPFDNQRSNCDNGETPRVVDPPNLLDITDDGGKAEELSRFMADSRLNEGSRSRSRSRGAASNNNLFAGSKISSVNMAAFSKLKGSSNMPNDHGFRTVKEMELDQTQGGQTGGGLDDDTHLFELTEKSNNTYMALSYWNHTQNAGVVGGPAGVHTSTTPHTMTQGTTPETTQRGAPITEACREDQSQTTYNKQVDIDSSTNNAMSINFKNSIYSKIKFDPSVHNLAPSMISARHQAMHSDASASQISAMGMTNQILGRNGVITYRNDGCSLEDDAESEVPGRNFLNRQKLLSSSSSSPQIDIEEVMRRNQQLQTRSRLGSNRGNKSVPNIRDVKQDDTEVGVSRRYAQVDGGQSRDELSRRDLSARFDAEEGYHHQEITNFAELGGTTTQRSAERSSDSPSGADDFQRQMPMATAQQMMQQQYDHRTRQTDFSEKVYNLMSPPEHSEQTNKTAANQQKKQKSHKPDQMQDTADDTSSSFLQQLQNLDIPESSSNASRPQQNLMLQHQFLQTEQYEQQLMGGDQQQPKHHAISNTDEKHSHYFHNTKKQSTGGSSGLTALASSKKVDESASKMRYKDDLPKQQQASKMLTDELESDKQSSQVQQQQNGGNPSLLQAYQEQVRLARARLQNQSTTTSNINNSSSHAGNQGQGLTTDQQAQLIKQQYDSVPSVPKRIFTAGKESAEQQNTSVGNLDGEQHRSDFTFVLSQPFTECHNCGVANGSIILDNTTTNVNGSILQSHGLRSSIGDTSMQIRKKVLTNFYSNGLPMPPGANQNHQQAVGTQHSGTASFPDGILNGVNSSVGHINNNFQSAKSSEPRVMAAYHQENSSELRNNAGNKQMNGGLRNRLPEIAASPIYSESGGAPGRKFFMSINGQAAAGPAIGPGLPRPNQLVDNDQSRKESQQLICNSNGQLRLSQIQHTSAGIAGQPHDITGGASHHDFQPMTQLVNNFTNDDCDEQRQQHSDQVLQSPTTNEDTQRRQDDQDLLTSPAAESAEYTQAQNLHELFQLQQQELFHARTLLLHTFEHLQRTVQHGWTMETQDEALKLMQVIQQSTCGGPLLAQHPQQHHANQYGAGVMQIPEDALEEEEDEQQQQLQYDDDCDGEQLQPQQYHRSRQQFLVTEKSVEHGQHMTESEIMTDNQRQKVDNKVFFMPKQVEKRKQPLTTQYGNLMLDESIQQQETSVAGAEEDDRLDEQHLQVKHLESNGDKAQQQYAHARGGSTQLKNSLLSSGVQDNTLYDLDKDTVYSFFAEESEIMPRPNQRKKERADRKAMNIIDGKTSFIASRSPKEYNKRHSNAATGLPAEDSDENNGDILAKTRSQLKTEKQVNREQSDKLKQMQAQIDMLTQKWSITENQLRNNGAIYSMLYPGSVGLNQQQASVWQPTATSITQNLTQRAINPAAYYSVLGGAGAPPQSQYNHQQSVNPQLDNKKSIFSGGEIMASTNTMPFSSPQLLGQTVTTAGAGNLHHQNLHPTSPFSHAPIPQTQHQLQQQQQQMLAQHQASTSTAVNQSSIHPADQSKHLIELNRQLSRQIESNMVLMDNLSCQDISIPSSSQQQMQQQQLQLQQPVNTSAMTAAALTHQQNQSLGSIDHANTTTANENVQSLITLTKITAEASEQAHSQHKEEMEKLRKRQMAFTAKIDQIGSKLSQQTKLQTKVGLKPSIRTNSNGSRQRTLADQQSAAEEQEMLMEHQRSLVQEGDGNTSSTFLDMTTDKVPTRGD